MCSITCSITSFIKTPLSVQFLDPMNSLTEWGDKEKNEGGFYGHKVACVYLALIPGMLLVVIETVSYLALTILSFPLVFIGLVEPFCHFETRSFCVLECGRHFMSCAGEIPLERAELPSARIPFSNKEEAKRWIRTQVEKEIVETMKISQCVP